MSYEITVFQSEKVKQGKVETYETFEALANRFNKYNIGDKLGSGFARGKLDPPIREDKNRIDSRLLIIDGDVAADGTNAPNPSNIHYILKGREINHFIYTSHSHSAYKNKFRCVIPTNIPYTTNDQLRNEIARVLQILSESGHGIKFVKEMKAWSQIWFDPRRSEHDGLFEFYFYDQGENWNVQESTQATEETSREESTQSGDTETLDQLYANIRTGAEYHESLRTLSYQLVKDNVSKAHVKAQLKSIMNNSADAGSERWNVRFEEIDRLVDGVKDEIESDFKVTGITVPVVTDSKLPRPPGLLGTLYDCAYHSMLYQYHEMAFVNTIGLVAGIAGRRFNINKPSALGLNVYMTIVAPTGVGKSGISTWFNMILRSGLNGALKPCASFLGPSNCTGAKAYHSALVNARSRVFIVPEQGLIMQGTSGDSSGRKAFVLDSYGNSHRNGYTGEAIYSAQEDSLPPLRAPCMSMIGESTIANVNIAYKQTQALESGFLPRNSMFQITDRQVDINEEVIWDFPKAIIDKLSELIETCSKTQAQDDPEPFELIFEPECLVKIKAFIRECNIASTEADSDVKTHMFTRMAVKAIKFAGIATVFNKQKGTDDCLIIGHEETDWAISMVRYEMSTIGEALAYLGNDNMSDAIKTVLIRLTELARGECNNKEAKLTKPEQKANLIPLRSLQKYCASAKQLAAITDSTGKGNYYKTGLDKVIDYLVQNKVIARLDVSPLTKRKQNCIQLMETFNDFCEQYR